jgi:acetyl-CoA C-acetyltransferase
VIPINISGGLKSKGHPLGATGVSQVYEITKQLRGEMVDQGRQVDGAKVGLVDTLGGDGIIVNLVLKRD